jgi:hypothetical protein
MTVAIIVLAACVVFLMVWKAHQEDRWEKERQVLLERIQAPERVRYLEQPPEDKEPLVADDPELARVGTIDYGEPDA